MPLSSPRFLFLFILSLFYPSDVPFSAGISRSGGGPGGNFNAIPHSLVARALAVSVRADSFPETSSTFFVRFEN